MREFLCSLGTEFWAGLLGALAGGLITLIGQWLKFRWETSRDRKRDDHRKALLRKMLNNPGPTGWRKLSTMASVIGANEEETARLLIECDARASEGNERVWAYIKDKPLPN